MKKFVWMSLFVLLLLASPVAAQEVDEQWAYGNLQTSEIIVVMESDLGSVKDAKLIHEQWGDPRFVSLLIDEPRARDYDGNADCVAYKGMVEIDDGFPEPAFAIFCRNGSSMFMVLASASVEERSLAKLVDSIVLGGKPKIPAGFIDMTALLDD